MSEYPEFTTVTTPACMVCGETSEITVETFPLNTWRNGALLQNAFPEMTSDERELLKTGTHPACWDVLNPDEDDEWYEGDDVE